MLLTNSRVRMVGNGSAEMKGGVSHALQDLVRGHASASAKVKRL